jgi:hypothetical protein
METATLATLLEDLQHAIGDTTDPAQGRNARGGLLAALRRHQTTLYLENDWPFLKVQKTITLNPGQRYYDIPEDLNLESVTRVEVHYGGTRTPVERGIGAEQYATFESEQTPATGSFTVTAGSAAAATGGFTINAGSAGASNYISQVAVNGTNFLAANLLWQVSHASTARALVVAINARTSTHGYTASSVGAAVTITADPDLGAAANGYDVVVSVNGSVTVTSVTNMAGGANNRVETVLVGGVNILPSPVGWRTSNTATATAIAARINEGVTDPGYTATALANTVTITELATNADVGNDDEIEVTVDGDVTTGTPVDMSGGILSMRSDPVIRWDFVLADADDETAQIEVWPVPAATGSTLRLYGIRSLRPMVEESDYCTLDKTLIVLFAAAEHLERKGAKNAKTMAGQALRRLSRLKGKSKKSGTVANLAAGGSMTSAPRPRIRVAYVRN